MARLIRATRSTPANPSAPGFAGAGGEPLSHTITVQEAIDYAVESSDEAYNVAREENETDRVAAAMMRDAFRYCLPALTCRGNVQAYIACVAVGIQNGLVSALEARPLLYAAQLALAAHSGGGGGR